MCEILQICAWDKLSLNLDTGGCPQGSLICLCRSITYSGLASVFIFFERFILFCCLTNHLLYDSLLNALSYPVFFGTLIAFKRTNKPLR